MSIDWYWMILREIFRLILNDIKRDIERYWEILRDIEIYWEILKDIEIY